MNRDIFQRQVDIALRVIGAIAIALLLLGIGASFFAQQQSPLGKLFNGYKVTGDKVATWTGFAIGGAMWGGREAYHADLRVFEKKWGVDAYSFFGSQAWQRNYEGNRYRNKDGSINAHKPEIGNSLRDYWHFSGAASRTLWIGGTFIIGAKNQKLKHKLIDMAIGSAISVTSAWATYNYLRN